MTLPQKSVLVTWQLKISSEKHPIVLVLLPFRVSSHNNFPYLQSEWALGSYLLSQDPVPLVIVDWTVLQ
jgi:hypothetical protein